MTREDIDQIEGTATAASEAVFSTIDPHMGFDPACTVCEAVYKTVKRVMTCELAAPGDPCVDRNGDLIPGPYYLEDGMQLRPMSETP